MQEWAVLSADIREIDMTSLTFNVPYFYAASYRPPRKQKAIDGTFAGAMDIEIESVTSMEAPVVATITRDDGINRVSREFVAYEGSYYTSQNGSWWRENQEEISIAQFDASHLELHPERSIAHFNAGDYSETPDGAILCVEGRYNPDNFEAAIETKKDEVRAAAAKLLFVNGILLKQCDLPTIRAKIEYRSTRYPISIDLGKRDETLGSHGAVFALDQLAAAEAWAADRQRREPVAEVDNYLSVEIHQPHLMPENTIFADEAISVVEFVMSRNIDLKEQSDEYLLKFVEARKALKNAIADRSDDNITTMLETWIDLYRQYGVDEEIRCRRYSMSFDIEDQLDYKALMGISIAWENRPILENDSGFSLRNVAPTPR